MPLCTAGQDPGFRTMCQRVSKPRPCWRGSDGPTGGLWTGEKKKTPNKPVNKTTQLVSSAWETRTSPRQKLLGITFPNHWKMPAHPFLLVAMVRDDGAPDGYNTRQRAGKGFSRGRREASSGKRGRRCRPVATPPTSTDGHHGPAGEVRAARGSGRAQQWVHGLFCSSCKNG